jgi:predicted nucleic acid-binding protein
MVDAYASGRIALIAPDLLISELASLLAKRKRRKEISANQAQEAFQLSVQCAPRLLDTRPRVSRALALSLQHEMSFWDCVYVAIATEHGCPLLTADRRLFRAGRGRHSCLRLVE